MFNILVGTRTLTKNYQTFKKSIFGAMNEISRVFAPLLFKFLRLPKFLSSSFENIDMMHT